jgi:hypothetical protein
MATSLTGYGPFSITTNDDFDLKALGIDGSKAVLLTIGLKFGTFDGNVTIKSRRRNSSDSFVTQSYVRPDGSVVSTALAADTVVQVDATGKDIRLTTASSSTGTLTAGIDVVNDL